LVACGGSPASVTFVSPEPEGLAPIRALLPKDPAAAETRARALLETTEATAGEDSLEVAAVLDVLVEALWREGKTDEATLALARRALSIKTERLGDASLELAPSLRNLGEALRRAREYDEAGRQFERAVQVVESARGADHPDLALHLRDLGNLQLTLGEYQQALESYERALALKERQLGAADPELVAYVYNISITLRRLGRFADARPYVERALTLKQREADPDPRTLAAIRNGLGVLLWETGDYAGARSEFERVLEIRVQKLGEDHIEVSNALNNLGRLLVDTGDYVGARSHHTRALAIRQERLDPEDPRIAQSLQNLGTLLVEMGHYEEARAPLEAALEVRVRLYGEMDSRVANTLRSLAELSSNSGDLKGAESLHHRAIAILGETLDVNHPEYAWHLQGLGRICEDRGELAKALKIYLEVLGIREATLGSRHPRVAETASRLARTQARTGNEEAAFEQALRAEQLSREHLILTARTLPEREALRYAGVRSSGLDVALSLLGAESNPARIEQAWDALIRSRALVLDEMAARHRATLRPADPAIAALHDEFREATWELAKLTVRGVGSDPEGYREKWVQARHRRERAERQLAEHSQPFREEMSSRRVGLSDVAERLPARAGLVAFALYGQYDFDADRGEPTPSYLAFVLRPGERRFVVEPLGPAARIDGAVRRWKAEAAQGAWRTDRSQAQAEGAYIDVAGALRSLIWDPLQSHLDDVETVFIVPDSALNLVGFYALPDRDGRYLIEHDLLVHYLAAERDLVRLDDPREAGRGLLAVGGPDFNSKRSFSALATQARLEPKAETGGGATPGRRPVCSDFSSLRFADLPEADREAREIAGLWTAGSTREALRLSGEEATEAAFKRRAPGRQVVHLATHGFFIRPGCIAAGEGSRGIGGLAGKPGGPARDRPAENPLLLSGLVLAGANHRDVARASEEDGILTAEEIAALDLSSVEWAVLSACDTGVGEIQAGEGVFGLRRAFQVAGAATTIMSLWSVEDSATRAWMQELYEARLNEGLDSAGAVRQASLQLLRRSQREGAGSHPFSWGGWVAAGDYR